jgi:hypothetical protein
MDRRVSGFAALALLAPLSGCGEPSAGDVANAIGHSDISDVSCVQANGQPGYVCTFTYLNFTLTRRFIKLDNGKWDVVF